MNKKAAGAVLVAGLALAGCTTSAASDEMYVHKGGGVFEAKTDKGCVNPADREMNGPGDSYFAYPAGQRTYAFTGAKGDDGAPFDVVSKDGQPMTIPGTLSFNLTSDCKVLQKFHDKIGNRLHAYMDNGETSDGWRDMLNKFFRPAIDGTLDRVAKQYNWRDLYSDPAIKDEINKQVNAQVATLIDQQFEGDEHFFTGYSALIQQPKADGKLVEAVKQLETAKAEAAAAKAKAEADATTQEATARAQKSVKEAELAVAKIEAQIRQQEIKAYGGAENWTKMKAVEKGINPWQPNYGGGTIVDPPK